MPTPGVGEDIEDICTRCGDTWHVVMAKVGDRVAKVVCKLCGSQHNYRGDKQTSAAGGGGAKSSWSVSRKRRPAKAPTVVAAPVVFDPTKPPRTYVPKDEYRIGERVTHKAFGIGVVSAAPAPGKIEVHFPGGLRTLACAKALSTLERPVAVENLDLPDHPPAPKASQGNGSGA